MEVSNSTGQSTDYRVGASSGGAPSAQGLKGRLKPGAYDVVKPADARSWKVEFLIDGRVVASKEVKSPKTLVYLVRSETGYRVVASVAPLDAFITYSAGEKEWARKLEAALKKNGVSTWLDVTRGKPEPPGQDELRKAASEAKNIVVVIGPTKRVSEKQRQEWMAALEAVWRDEGKRLIPLLLQGVEVPGFFRSAASPDRPVTAIRVEDTARGWDRAVADLVKVLKSEADPREKGEIVGTTAEDRRHQQEWFDYLGEVAESFRSARQSGR